MRLVAGALAVLAFAVVWNGPGRAQAPTGGNPLILPVTEGKGPGERVREFVVAPGAADARLPDAAIAQLAASLAGGVAAQAHAAEVELGLQTLNDGSGAIAALGTIGEHALFDEQFTDVNNALAFVGLAIGLAQVGRDVWNGQYDAAIAGEFKTLMGFAISKWGTGAMQIGSIATFVIDITLREWQKGVVETAVEGLRCHYTAWYREHPRSVGEWKERSWKFYLAAERRKTIGFAQLIDQELDRYVGLAFADPQLITTGDCGKGTMGLGHRTVEEKLEAEHKMLLQKMLAELVMPEVGERAWRRNLAAQVAWANTHLRPRLNRELTLEITAYGYPDEARVVMPLPTGGEWSGRLRPWGSFKARLTKFAIAKAGFPEVVRIETATGAEQRRLTLAGDRLMATFGAPETPLVSRYRLSEQAGRCRVVRIDRDGNREEETIDAAARGAAEVDFAMLPNGDWVFGAYAPGSGWSTASPGATSTGRIDFGAPLFDGITAFKGCSIGFLAGDQVARSSCTVERYDEKQVTGATRIQRTCTAPARLELAGVLTAMVAGEMTWYPLDGPEGKMIVDMLKRGIEKGVVGGMPGTAGLEGLPGMPALPGGN